MPSRSQRTRSVLTFFAEDADSHALLYANADLAKATQTNEVLAFADHWKTVTGTRPGPAGHGLQGHHPSPARRTDRPRHRLHHPARPHPQTHRRPARPARQRLDHDDRGPRRRHAPAASASSTTPPPNCPRYPGTLRQLAVAGLGHDEPTILITNRDQLPAKQIIETYARRMNIEQRLAEAIRSFGLDALAGAVPLNVDLDVVLSVLAHTVCAALRRRLPGYATATPDTLQRRFLSTGGHILNRHNEIVIRLDRRTYSPVLRQADLPDPSPSPGSAAAPCATSTPDQDRHQSEAQLAA